MRQPKAASEKREGHVDALCAGRVGSSYAPRVSWHRRSTARQPSTGGILSETRLDLPNWSDTVPRNTSLGKTPRDNLFRAKTLKWERGKIQRM